jgi:hypothetical protein
MMTAAAPPRVRLPHRYDPRPYQLPFFRAFDKGIRRLVTVWHRRAGKDKTAFNLMIREAVTGRVGNYYYVFPSYTQGKKALWDNIDSQGFRVLDHCPRELLKNKPNESELSLDFINGSTLQIVGSVNPDALRGPNPCGVVFSEYAEQSPAAWQVVKPILIENRGWAVFNFTPRGTNHAFDLYDEARDDPTWYSSLLTVDDTGVLDAAQLAEARKGSSEEFFRQEYYCDFESGNEGSYYGRLLAVAKDDGRISRVPYEPGSPVHTSWDLGVGDATAVWFFQVVGRERRYIDYYEASGEGLPHYIHTLQQRGYVYGRHFAPHDIEVREFSSGVSRIDTARNLGIRFETIPQHAVEDRIETTRQLIPRCVFDAERCKDGIAALRSYHKERDEKRDTWRPHPVHDWSSHGADAFGYGAMARVDGPQQSWNRPASTEAPPWQVKQQQRWGR